MNEYSKTIHTIAEEKEPVSELPEDIAGLEQLSYAVKNLALTLRVRTSVVEAERARLATVLDQMTDGVLIADAAGRVQFANPAIERLFETRDVIGRTVVEVLRQHQLIEAWQRCQQTGELQTESVELPGRRQFLQLIAIPDRETGGSLLLVQDLTRVRRLETVRRDFISNVSHELRTPLASLKALTETLQEGALEDPPAARRFIDRIETEVDALTQMATELLELSRIELGQVPLEFKPVPAASLLLSVADRMHAQAERAGVVLRAGCTCGHWPRSRQTRPGWNRCWSTSSIMRSNSPLPAAKWFCLPGQGISSAFLFRIPARASRPTTWNESSNASTKPTGLVPAAGPGWGYPSRDTWSKPTAGKSGWRVWKGGGAHSISRSRWHLKTLAER